MMTDIIPKQNRLHEKDHKAVYVDPVCGMSTKEPDTYQELVHDDKTYYFCSDHCLTKFKADPEGFISVRLVVLGVRSRGYSGNPSQSNSRKFGKSCENDLEARFDSASTLQGRRSQLSPSKRTFLGNLEDQI